jgi:hypothetical protein
MRAAAPAALGEPMSLNRLFPRRVRRAALALCAAAVLAACGGGDRSEPVTPGRIFAFGDELSALDTTTVPGQTVKYSVIGYNATATTQPDCAVNPLWIQTLAASFSMGFAQCAGGYTNLSAVTRATAGAKVADLTAQVDTYVNGDHPVSNDLVTMLVGSNDVLELYQSFKSGALTHDAAVAVAKQRAQALAAQVDRVVKLGPPVLVATVPYLGASPFAVAEEAASPGQGRQQALFDLVSAFNDALVSGGIGEGASKGLASYGLTGKDYGLIQTSTSWIKAIYESTSSDVRAYSATAMCDPTKTDSASGVITFNGVLPTCSTNTLVSGADLNNWVWADGTRPGYAFQVQLGARAATMAGPRGLPF